MQRIIILSILLLAAMHLLCAQSNRQEFRAGYGVLSGIEVGLGFADAVGTAIGSSLALAVGETISIIVNGQPANVTVTSIDHKDVYYGTFSGNYNYYLTRRLSLGVQGSYTPIDFKDVVYYSNGQRQSYHNRYNILQLYGRLDFHYIDRPRFQMYSGIMAGGIYIIEDSTSSWAGHVNLLGFRFGKKHAFYTELGLGFSSTLAAGYSVRF
jgi:hypothetical protein